MANLTAAATAHPAPPTPTPIRHRAPHASEPLAGPRDRLPGAVHGRARRDHRERRAARRSSAACTSRPRTCSGWSTPTRSSSAASCCSAAAPADLLGRKRLFMAGIALFSLASLLNGLAQTSGMLIVGRGLQGLGGALLSPAALSIITTTFTEHERAHQGARRVERDRRRRRRGRPAARRRAHRARLVAVDLHRQRPGRRDRRWSRRCASCPSRGRTSQHRTFDLAGAVTVTGGLVVLVYAIVKAQAFGWGSARTIGLIAAGARAARRVRG